MRQLASLAALILVLAACSAGPGAGGQLEGSRWVLRSFDVDGTQVLVSATEYADAEFTAGRVSGFGGCGTYDAIARHPGRTLLVSHVATTLQSCGEELDAFQRGYLAHLSESRHYTVRDRALTIFGDDGTALLVFDAAPRNPLLGTWDIGSYATEPGTVVAPLEDTTLTVTFRLTEVGGFAGCNGFDGTYSTNGNVVRIGRLATTRIACADDVMAQELAVLDALGGVAFLEPRGTTMILRDRLDRTTLILVRPTPPVDPSASASADPTPSESAAASEEPTATPTAEPTASPTPAPTASPTPAPTPSPTPAPTDEPSAAPSVAPSAAPTVAPPSPLPETAVCSVDGSGGVTLTMTYPASWSTIESPPPVACRFFDPEPITVPEDPLAIEAAVALRLDPNTPYADAVEAATDRAAWQVTTTTEVTILGRPATLVAATSTDEAATGSPVGGGRYVYLIDLGPAGTASLGADDDAGLPSAEVTGTVDLIASLATVTIPD